MSSPAVNAQAFRICDHCEKCCVEDPAVQPKDSQGNIWPTVAQLDVCGRCFITPYCSMECRIAGWSAHIQVCNVVSGLDKQRYKTCIQRAITQAMAEEVPRDLPSYKPDQMFVLLKIVKIGETNITVSQLCRKAWV